MKNKLPKNYFKPKTNSQVNRKLVKNPFDERVKNFQHKKDKSVKKI